MLEGRHRVVHEHAVEVAVWAEADGGSMGADDFDDGFGDLEMESGPVGDTATPLIGALVARVLEELIRQISIGTMDFHAIKPRIDGIPRRRSIILDSLLDILLRHGLGGRIPRRDSLGRAGQEGEAAGLEDWGDARAAHVPQLAVDLAALGVDGVGDGAPALDVGVGPDAGDVGGAGGAVGDEGRLGDEEGAWEAGALFVVLWGAGGVSKGKLEVLASRNYWREETGTACWGGGVGGGAMTQAHEHDR